MSIQAQPVATTDSANIGHLYQSFSETVPAKAVDPSTPWEELTELWIDHPRAMLENPILALKSLSEGKPLYDILPRICYLSLYVHLSRQADPDLLDSYIPEERRLGDGKGLRDWWYTCKWSFLDRVYTKRPALFETYVEVLAKEPSRRVRARAAEKLPASHLAPFLNDPDPDVVRSVINNLRDHFRTLGPLWKKPHIQEDHRLEYFIKTPVEVKEDVLAIARKLQHHSRMETRALNLAQDYAQDDMLEYAIEHEEPDFFGQFAMWRDWRRNSWDGRSLDLSYSLIDKAFEQTPEIALLVAKHFRTDQIFRWRLTRHSDPKVSSAAWEQIQFRWPITIDVVEEDFEELVNQGFRASWFEALAQKEGLSRTIEKRLWDLGGTIRKALFNNPKPSREVAKELIRTKSADELIPEVNASAHSFLIRKAARHEDPRLRAAAARLPGRAASSLRPQLVKDPDNSVRHAVADYYLSHGDARYHGEHYANTLSELTRDPDPEIRKKICRDWRITEKDLSQLVKDPVPEVALEILSQRTWQCFQYSLPLFAVKEVAIREQAARLVLDERACELKWHPTFFRKFESALLKDNHPALRWLLANDPWTSPQALRRLMKDPEPLIQKATISGFLQAEQCPAREHFLEQVDKEADELASSRNPWYRACLAFWDREDRIRHRILARDKHWFVRAITAADPRLHPYLRDELSRDRHPLVRAAATETLDFETKNPYPTKL